MLKLRISCSRWNNSHSKIHTILLSLLSLFPSHKSLNAPSATKSFGKVHFLLTLDAKVPSILCQHHFHSNCLKTWARKQPSCPICRKHLQSWLQSRLILTSFSVHFFVTSFHFILFFLAFCFIFARNSFLFDYSLTFFFGWYVFLYIHYLILVKLTIKINEWQMKNHLLFFSSYFDLPFDLKYSSGTSKIRLKVATKFLHFPPSTYLWSTTKFTIAVFATITFPSSTAGSSWTAFNAAKTVHPVNPEFKRDLYLWMELWHLQSQSYLKKSDMLRQIDFSWWTMA